MKKKAVLILSVFLALSFLTACVKKEQASSEAVEGSKTYSALDSLIFAPLCQYVRENITLMGTFLHRPPVLYDVTGDGNADLCASVTTGSGIISTLVVVYDVKNSFAGKDDLSRVNRVMETAGDRASEWWSGHRYSTYGEK